MRICEYGCGKKAKHQFKNGKWCCSIHWNSCPERKNRIGKIHRGKTISEKQKRIVRKKLLGRKHSEKAKEKIRKARKKYPHISEKQKIKISKTNRLTISKIKKQHSLFFKIEEMRYNPDKPGEKEIQVHCKYSKCENSKTNKGWFTPTKSQLSERFRALENQHGMIENNFYCSNKCKSNCKLYNLKSPLVNTYTSSDRIFREEVLRRQKEEYGYNFCEYCDSEKDLHVHHEKTRKTHPLFILDPDNGIVLCKDCHYLIGHKKRTECSTGRLAKKNC